MKRYNRVNELISRYPYNVDEGRVVPIKAASAVCVSRFNSLAQQ